MLSLCALSKFFFFFFSLSLVLLSLYLSMSAGRVCSWRLLVCDCCTTELVSIGRGPGPTEKTAQTHRHSRNSLHEHTRPCWRSLFLRRVRTAVCRASVLMKAIGVRLLHYRAGFHRSGSWTDWKDRSNTPQQPQQPSWAHSPVLKVSFSARPVFHYTNWGVHIRVQRRFKGGSLRFVRYGSYRVHSVDHSKVVHRGS